MPRSDVYCMDCLEAIKKLPDNAFDLAVVDPPYGDALEHTHTHTQLRCHGGDRWDKYSMESLRSTVRPLQDKHLSSGGGITARSIPHWRNVG